MTGNPTAVHDCSTLTNFKQWAQVVSNFMATIGWTKTSDTGQVNWATIGAVPGAGSFVFEIWQPGDALTPFYLKIEYGIMTNYSNVPRMRWTIGTGTSGAGALTGYVTSSFDANNVGPVSSTTTQWDCRLSGDASYVSMLMWRDESNFYAPRYYGVERSIDSSGTYTSDYVTLVGGQGTNSQGAGAFQQSLVFGFGVGLAVTPGGGYPFIGLRNGGIASANFGGRISVGPVFPDVGYFGNPLTLLMFGAPNDFTEGTPYTILAANMPYGVAHTYIATKRGGLVYSAPSWPWNVGNVGISPAVLLRYD